jgi:RNA polymerase sigma-70 factor (ECF subfamily)
MAVGSSAAQVLAEPKLTAAAASEVDVAEFERLYRANYDVAHRWARALGASRDLAEDVVQDAFIIAFRRRDSFDPSRSFRAWLLGIVRRVLSERRRSSQRSRARESKVDATGAAADPHEVLALKRARELVEGFLAGIDRDQSLVFTLCELEELSAPEAAAVLELPVKTVRARLRIARKKFERTIARLRAREEGPNHA